MRRLLFFGLASLTTASLALAAGTPLNEHGIGNDCWAIRGEAQVYSPLTGVVPATGPGWLQFRGRRIEGTFTASFELVGLPMMDFQSETLRQSSNGFEIYAFGENVIYARDVAVWSTSFYDQSHFDVYGATLSGPFDLTTGWGSGAFQNALLSIRFRGTIDIFLDGSSSGQFQIEDGTICNVDFSALETD